MVQSNFVVEDAVGDRRRQSGVPWRELFMIGLEFVELAKRIGVAKEVLLDQLRREAKEADAEKGTNLQKEAA